jgi:hypothetical protein
MTSSAATIRDELVAATLRIASSKRETGYFSVWIERKVNGMNIFVQFESDRPSPLTLLQAFSVSLTGNMSMYISIYLCCINSTMCIQVSIQISILLLYENTPLFPPETLLYPCKHLLARYWSAQFPFLHLHLNLKINCKLALVLNIT